MDALLIILFCLATAVVVAPGAFILGVVYKDQRWKSALRQYEQTGIAIARAKAPSPQMDMEEELARLQHPFAVGRKSK